MRSLPGTHPPVVNLRRVEALVFKAPDAVYRVRRSIFRDFRLFASPGYRYYCLQYGSFSGFAREREP